MTNVNVTFEQLPPVVGSLTGSEIVPLDQGGTTKKVSVRGLWSGSFTSNFPAAIEYVMDGGGAAISSPGVKGYLTVPFSCTLTSVMLLADRAGSAVVDIWACPSSAFDAINHPVAADSITGGNYPTIVSTTSYTNASLPGWTTSITGGTVLGYYLQSNSAIQRLTVSLNATRLLSS